MTNAFIAVCAASTVFLCIMILDNTNETRRINYDLARAILTLDRSINELRAAHDALAKTLDGSPQHSPSVHGVSE